MSQVFRLALYFRPLRRMYDPNPDIIKASGSNFETVYMDRIWRVLRPEQIAAIREMNLTRKDMDKYLKEHVQLYKVDPKKDPVFALLEYAVNDFHEQIAPPDTIPPEEKGDFFIPASVKRLSGAGPDDGKKLFEGICASCHGVDGQGRFPPITMQSYLSLHSDHEHFEIVRFGPPQKPGSPIVMPTFADKLTEQQMWAIVKYLRTFEGSSGTRRGENEAREKGVKFYDTPEVYAAWQAKDSNKFFLDLQSDIAYRIMGHIPNSVHIRPEELAQKMDQLPKDKEIIVIDMFGSQGLAPAKMLAEAGYRTSYMGPGMMDWHITRNYPVSYD
jgi:mono/diheme cytochrome c family protein